MQAIMKADYSSEEDNDTETKLASGKKRKRAGDQIRVLEVDVGAPEPPSKKALRQARKKVKSSGPATFETKSSKISGNKSDGVQNSQLSTSLAFGIWIGNLPWSATAIDVRNFITSNAEITDPQMTRLHMPGPGKSDSKNTRLTNPQNKGFAYIDFSSESAQAQALALSEKLLRGRPVLIKDAKNFKGRPKKTKEGAANPTVPNSNNPPNRRVFVGNLAFDATKEDLENHFVCCGEIQNVHLATFEDSGKCKAYAWVDFAELDGSQAAVRGWVEDEAPEKGNKQDENQNEKENGHRNDTTDEDNDDTQNPLPLLKPPKNKPKVRKRWVNRFKGRLLRIEFAEDKTVRYKKRFGKDKDASSANPNLNPDDVNPPRESQARTNNNAPDSAPTATTTTTITAPNVKRATKEAKPRTQKSSTTASLAPIPKSTGTIVPSQGKKTKFT